MREHYAQRFDFAAALCDVTIKWRVVLLFSLKKVRFSFDRDGLRALTHATFVVNHEQTQHAKSRARDYARHVMHSVERRCGAYGLLFFVPRSTDTDKI